MTLQIDRRDHFSYAEGRRLAERERAIAIRLHWRSLADYVRRRLAAPAATSGTRSLPRAGRAIPRAG